MKKKYITIAKKLGIVLPACLLFSSIEANAENENSSELATVQKEDVSNLHIKLNPVKERIVQSFNSETTFSPYQIDHTNIHANHRISHTNIHADYVYDRKHTNDHSNTPAHHVNDHSNSPL